jgi:hypothetical protein
MSVTSNFQSSIYVLDDKSDTYNEIDYRWRLIKYYFQNRINDSTINSYGVAYTLLPEYLMAGAYLPFNHKYYDLNFNYLTLKDTLNDDYYTNVYKKDLQDIDKLILFKEKLDITLRDILKELDNTSKIYNKINFIPVIVVCCLVWFIIIMFLLKVLYYYYYQYYGMIIIVMSISLLIFGVIWKMIYIMRS